MTKKGTGTLTLTGRNRYRGGTVLAAGTLVAGSDDALGHGDVRVTAGTLRVTEQVFVRDTYTQDAGTLEVTLGKGRRAPLRVRHLAVLGKGTTLSLNLDTERPPAAGSTLAVIDVPRLRGQFDTVELNSATLRAVPVYTADGLSVRLVKR
ncbi:autotransporter-associated beta strand repeat-containing protein [Streptomyces sp. NPDC005917]|uniref:autotransporter-associated beta strand repeat-containing protein n=1 Tax=unclassified Streptomyces TaxID=2593676 RepID=UPI00340EB0F4